MLQCLKRNSQKRNRNLKKTLNDNEQRSRKECLLLHIIEESDCDDTDQIITEQLAEKLDISISIKDIKNSFHSKTPTKGYSQQQTYIFVNKKKFNNSGITLTKNLNIVRLEISKKAVTK